MPLEDNMLGYNNWLEEFNKLFVSEISTNIGILDMDMVLELWKQGLTPDSAIKKIIDDCLVDHLEG